MTTREFSDEFDALAKIKGLPYELDEYEKSMLLTSTQDELVLGLYNGTLKGEGFESTEELRRYLDVLITSYRQPVSEVEKDTLLTDRSHELNLPDNILYILQEQVILKSGVYCDNVKTMSVVPVRYDEWNRVKENPFKRPNSRKAVRLESGNNRVEIISEYPIDWYEIRYLRKPVPIILTDLPDGLKINGESRETQCELNEALHRLILKLAINSVVRKTE